MILDHKFEVDQSLATPTGHVTKNSAQTNKHMKHTYSSNLWLDWKIGGLWEMEKQAYQYYKRLPMDNLLPLGLIGDGVLD